MRSHAETEMQNAVLLPRELFCSSLHVGRLRRHNGNVFSAMSNAMMVMLSQSMSDDMLSMLTQLMTSLIDSDSNAIMSRTIMS